MKNYVSYSLNDYRVNRISSVINLLKLPTQYSDIFSQYDLISQVQVGIYQIESETIAPAILSSKSYCFLILKNPNLSEQLFSKVLKLVTEIHQDICLVDAF